MIHQRIVVVISLLLAASGIPAGGADQPDRIVLSNDRFEAIFSRENGSIVHLSQQGQQGTILRSSESGLWQARLTDNTRIDAASFSVAWAERRFGWEYDAQADVLRMSYDSPELTVVVTATCGKDGVDFVADVTPHEKTLLEFALPGRLQFNPDELQRLVCPTDGNGSPGMSLRGSFFKLQDQWQPVSVGGKGYESLLGGQPVVRPDADPPTPIRVTDEGRKWLGPGFSETSRPLLAIVNRPPQAGQFDLVLADSDYGPFFSSRQLDSGRLWRLGGTLCGESENLAMDMVIAALTRLAEERPEARGKIGLLSLRLGPAYGGFTCVSAAAWAERLRGLPSVASGKVQFAVLETVEQLTAAQADGDFMAILNPYGEWLPVSKAGEMAAAVARIEHYIRRGGQWFEVAGYPFYCELQPTRGACKYECNYPPAFVDFFHLQTTAGTAAVFRVQPRDWTPWEGAKDHHAIFLPGRIACGGDDRGGWCDRSFAPYIAPKQTWRCPVVRLTVGGSAQESLQAYGRANGIARRLEDKMPPELLEKLKRSVLVYYGGNCKELLRDLNLLPVPTQIHTADYLQGGFDKQYPDHLPPRPDFGTPEEFRQFFDQSHTLGHLVVPYTNPTWWCDGPKGPTFARCGEAPLLKTLDGNLSSERYVHNTGFTICHWHSAVQEANRRTTRQFREEYPVDILFQDQCGARGWQYDANPASPTPAAYTEGLLSMIDEDCQQVPLSTESGWDRVVNAESQLCGLTFEIMPSDGRMLLKHRYDPATWEIFPLAQYLAHDKLAMIHHDLGQSVSDREKLSWTLGLGYAMSYRLHAPALQDAAIRQWLLWLDRLQKSVCARYVGQSLTEFAHDWESGSPTHENGVIRTRYGAIHVVANLGSQPRQDEGWQLAGYGFWASAPGMLAANLGALAEQDFGKDGVSFIAEENGQRIDVWIYARPNEDVAVLLPTRTPNPIKLTFDDGHESRSTVQDSVHRFRLPDGPLPSEPRSGNIRYLWHAVATTE